MFKKFLLVLATTAVMLLAGCEEKIITIEIMGVAGVELNETNATLTLGKTLQLTATVIPDDASEPAVTWTNDNTAVVSLDDNGLVTALAYGTATITASAGGESPKSATCTIVVSPKYYVLTVSNNQPQLWINGESQWTITDGSTFDTTYGGMTVLGGDVYLPVSIYDNTNYVNNAAYAKNGTVTTVTTDQSYAYNMAIDGSNMYVVGYATTPDWNSYATIWQNGEATTLGVRSSYAYDVAVAGDNVYVVGQQQQDGGWNSEATVWTDGVAQTLNTYGSADQVVVSGTDVYVRGWSYDETNWQTIYTVWRNGEVLHTLPYEGYSAYIHEMAVAADGTVYVAGSMQVDGVERATLWVNGVAQTLGDATRKSEAYAISIFNDEVYVLGNYDVGAEAGVGTAYAPVIWKNGEEISTRIELGSWKSARAIALSVQE
jgi:hypothetical protein